MVHIVVEQIHFRLHHTPTDFAVFNANTDFSTMTIVSSPIGYTGELISPVIDLSGKPSALLI